MKFSVANNWLPLILQINVLPVLNYATVDPRPEKGSATLLFLGFAAADATAPADAVVVVVVIVIVGLYEIQPERQNRVYARILYIPRVYIILLYTKKKQFTHLAVYTSRVWIIITICVY